jgi:hypothetical protein
MVLCDVPRMKRVRLGTSGKDGSLADASSFALIEAFAKLRLRVKGDRPQPLLQTSEKQLLHYVRTLRNAGAHPDGGSRTRSTSDRDLAVVAARLANELYRRAASTDSRLHRRRVVPTWANPDC